MSSVLAISALLASCLTAVSAVHCIFEGSTAFAPVIVGDPSQTPALAPLVIGNSAALGATGTTTNTASYLLTGSGAGRNALQTAPPGGTACPCFQSSGNAAGCPTTNYPTSCSACNSGVSCPLSAVPGSVNPPNSAFPPTSSALGGTFGDGPWGSPALPAWVFETPVAIGSITIYTGGPAATNGKFANTNCLVLSDLCIIWNKNVASVEWSQLSVGKASGYGNALVEATYRTDSSGSTTVIENYLVANCLTYAGYNYPSTSYFPSASNSPPARFKGGQGTPAVVAIARQAVGRMCYAACAQPTHVAGEGYVYDFPVKNLVNTCNRCAASTTSYTDFNIKPHGPPNCDWTGSSPDGDADGDQDGAGDLDNDQDGISKPDFALVFLEFANLPRHPSPQINAYGGVSYFSCTSVFVNVAKYLLDSSTQNKMPPYGFYPLPSEIQAVSCSCLPQANTKNASGKIMSGKCT